MTPVTQQSPNLSVSVTLLNQFLWHWFKVVNLRCFTVPTTAGCSLKANLLPGPSSEDHLIQSYKAEEAWMKLPHICILDNSTMETLHVSWGVVPETDALFLKCGNLGAKDPRLMIAFPLGL